MINPQLELFANQSKQEIIQGDCLEIMRGMAENSIDFIVTDSPYGISFMGKGWDRGIPSIEYWQEMLRIVKPGGHLCAAGLPRMMHRLISVIEDAGWEIRDLIMHLFGQGFPKSHNFGRKLNEDWHGYGTALKPAWEGWTLAMKPLDGTFAQNAEKWGVAGINVDASRIGTEGATKRSNQAEYPKNEDGTEDRSQHWARTGHNIEGLQKGRWPSNLILSEESAAELDQMTGNSKSNSNPRKKGKSINCFGQYNKFISDASHLNDSGGASRFFYCAKASSSERNRGLEGLPLKPAFDNENGSLDANMGSMSKPRSNFHPTVKPIALMKYILKLLSPPGNPTCLDPFAGSGSTLVAAKELDINCIGIEKEEEYCEIARKRIEGA